MCGIVGFTGAAQAAPILLDGLAKLEYRGYDSAGMAVQTAAGKMANRPSSTHTRIIPVTRRLPSYTTESLKTIRRSRSV